jgi:hypothetical protein
MMPKPLLNNIKRNTIAAAAVVNKVAAGVDIVTGLVHQSPFIVPSL